MSGDTTASEEVVEIRFRLDENGRTAPCLLEEGVEHEGGGRKDEDGNDGRSALGKSSSDVHHRGNESSFASSLAQSATPGLLDYATQTVGTTFRFVEKRESDAADAGDAHQGEDGVSTAPTFDTPAAGAAITVWDDLLLDCEIADSGLLPRTFWVPAADPHFVPRCSLEQWAVDVFQHHTTHQSSLVGQRSLDFDAATSGAEWWVQIRPSPDKTGRYAMHCPSTNTTTADDDELFRKGISFHWDKDEDLRLLCGGNTYVHPHLSTVTYLTCLGAPTVCLNYRVDNWTGAVVAPTPKEGVEAYVSFPRAGKHLSFDGRFLHAAIPDFLEDGEFERQYAMPSCETDGEKGTAQVSTRDRRRHRRVTFLVNIWLNYKPFNVELFPDPMLDKMSGHAATQDQARVGLSFQAPTNTTKSLTVNLNDDDNNNSDTNQSSQDADLRTFQWPMGHVDSDDVVRMVVPWRKLRSAAAGEEGNLRLVWSGTGGAHVGPRPTVDAQSSDERPGKRIRSDKPQQ